MTPEARAFIVKCFFGKVSAFEVAWMVNDLFDLHGEKVSAPEVRKIWDGERETNAVIRQFEERFGHRPVNGFRQDDHARVAERLVTI